MRRLVLLLALVLAACGGGEPGDEEVLREVERSYAQETPPLPGDAATEAPVDQRSVEAFVRDYQRLASSLTSPPRAPHGGSRPPTSASGRSRPRSRRATTSSSCSRTTVNECGSPTSSATSSRATTST
ncbi:hypothetical protein DVA67_023840 [Solirubrobacter sp. CPCC 204708]|nr:hypothetical protein [Solirubrobacter deserti]